MTRPVAERSRRRRMTVLLVVALALAAWLWPQRDLIAEHIDAGRASAPPVALRAAALSATMDEAALLRHYPGLAWRCAGAATARRCEAPLASADGVPAARLHADFAGGHLQALVLRVPWWRHHRLARTLVQSLGAPDAFTRTADGAADSIAWHLPGGRLDLPRAPGRQPLHWTELRWQAASAGMPGVIRSAP